jgi:hypothetical protein
MKCEGYFPRISATRYEFAFRLMLLLRMVFWVLFQSLGITVDLHSEVVDIQLQKMLGAVSLESMIGSRLKHLQARCLYM